MKARYPLQGEEFTMICSRKANRQQDSNTNSIICTIISCSLFVL